MIIDNSMNLFQSICIIKNFFYITYARNLGAAWSILYGERIILIIISIILIYLFYKYLIKDKNLSNKDNVVFGLLLGGVLGNLIDRVFRGFVIDYLDFKIFGYDYPVFNLSDILIVISVILIAYKVVRGDKSENRS